MDIIEIDLNYDSKIQITVDIFLYSDIMFHYKIWKVVRIIMLLLLFIDFYFQPNRLVLITIYYTTIIYHIILKWSQKCTTVLGSLKYVSGCI